MPSRQAGWGSAWEIVPQLGQDGDADADPVAGRDLPACPLVDAAPAVDVVAGSAGIQEESLHSHILRSF
jgi:hypothetical protein